MAKLIYACALNWSAIRVGSAITASSGPTPPFAAWAARCPTSGHIPRTSVMSKRPFGTLSEGSQGAVAAGTGVLAVWAETIPARVIYTHIAEKCRMGCGSLLLGVCERCVHFITKQTRYARKA